MRHLGFQVGNTKVMTRSGLVSREYVLICILDVKENIRHPSHKCWMGKKNKNIKFSHGARAATLKKSCQGIRPKLIQSFPSELIDPHYTGPDMSKYCDYHLKI